MVKHSAAAATSSTSNSLGPSESTPTAFDLVDLRAFVQNLNPNSHAILAAVIEFLAKVTTKAEQNRMPASNLGIVFGSNLMWNPDPAAVLDPSLLSRQGGKAKIQRAIVLLSTLTGCLSLFFPSACRTSDYKL